MGLAKGEEVICTRCIHTLPRTTYHSFADNPLYKRIGGRIPLRFACAFLLFRKGGPVQELLHELKYNNRPDIGRILGRVYGRELLEAGLSPQLDLIVPIPLHAWKRKRRGFNQSEEFAVGLAEAMDIPVQPFVVQRLVNTETQTRKSRLKRWENVSDVFAVTDHAVLDGKHVLLVDDVITTGATIEACGTALLEAGCSALSAVSIAYSGE
jgi:ComF family protein